MEHTEKFGIEQGDLNSILGVLKKNPRISEISIFGSRVKGNYSAGLDIDICIKGKNLNVNDIIEAKFEIDSLQLPYEVDIVIFQRITDNNLKNHIGKKAIPLYSEV